MQDISVAELVALIESDAECALIDPREEGAFVHAHLFAASNLPLSRLELTIRQAVPNLTTPIVLVDDLSIPRERVDALLTSIGYKTLKSLSGGLAAWHASGFPLFQGLNVPGKAFGEYVEHHLQPASISAPKLKGWLEAGKPLTLIDTRTPQEHRDACLPGAFNCPNGELSIRALELIAQSEGPVVTHCAGRTRSIIGAQMLIDLGVTQDVFALENGTVGWRAIGAELEQGANRLLPATDQGRAAGRAASADLIRQAGVRFIDLDTLAAFQAEPERTTILLDIRTAEEVADGLLPGARHVPGGQLIQTIDTHVSVRNARIVLCDDDGIRSGVLAFWLHRMGLRDVFVVSSGPKKWTKRPPSPPKTVDVDRVDVHQVDDTTPDQAIPVHNTKNCNPGTYNPDAPLPRPDELIVDIRSSLAYRQGHIPGSWFLTRADLERDLPRLSAHRPAAISNPDTPQNPNTPVNPDKQNGEPTPVVLISDDPTFAALMAEDLRKARYAPRLVMNGFARWCDAGGAVETGFTRLASPPTDMWFDGKHLEHPKDAARENRRHIAWETALIEDMGDEPSVRYL